MRSAHVAGVAERIAAGLRPHGEAVRLTPYGNRLHVARGRIDGVDDIIEAAREPQMTAVGGDIAHVGTAAAGNGPDLFHFAGGEIDHRHAALAVRLAAHHVRAAIGDVKLFAVAAGVKTMRSYAGLDEVDLLEGIAI